MSRTFHANSTGHVRADGMDEHGKHSRTATRKRPKEVKIWRCRKWKHNDRKCPGDTRAPKKEKAADRRGAVSRRSDEYRKALPQQSLGANNAKTQSREKRRPTSPLFASMKHRLQARPSTHPHRRACRGPARNEEIPSRTHGSPQTPHPKRHLLSKKLNPATGTTAGSASHSAYVLRGLPLLRVPQTASQAVWVLRYTYPVDPPDAPSRLSISLWDKAVNSPGIGQVSKGSLAGKHGGKYGRRTSHKKHRVRLIDHQVSSEPPAPDRKQKVTAPRISFCKNLHRLARATSS